MKNLFYGAVTRLPETIAKKGDIVKTQQYRVFLAAKSRAHAKRILESFGIFVSDSELKKYWSKIDPENHAFGAMNPEFGELFVNANGNNYPEKYQKFSVDA